MINFAFMFAFFVGISPWLLWGAYVTIMRLKMVRDAGQLTPAMKVFGYPFLGLGLLLDFFVNVVFGSAIFLERPKEWTLSSRLTRLADSGNPRQKKWALAIRTALLDNIDPAGIHTG